MLAAVALAVAVVATSQLLGARRQLLGAGRELRAARQALAGRDTPAASAAVDRGDRHFAAAAATARAFPLRILGIVPILGSPGRALAAVSRAGREAAGGARSLVAASATFPTSANLAVDGRDLSAFHAAAAATRSAIAEADARLLHADDILARPAGAMLPPVSRPARALRVELDGIREEIETAGRGMTLLEEVTGQDTDLRILLLAQDSLELRPTGGYIGSYGVLRLTAGTVRLESYAATEDLPDPAPPASAPDGLGLYLPGPWRLSNVNWWPDFPTSAAAAAEMFRRQGGGRVDGVLALTEYATARLIGAVGPLQLPGYAAPVVEAGFDRRAVFEVEQKNPADQPRKKFLIELADALFGRLLDLPAGKLPAVASAVRASVGTGDIQLWFADPGQQALLAGTAVSGALPKTDGDFLMVVDANLAAGKSNLDVVKRVDYRAGLDARGRVVGHVHVDVQNTGPPSSINPLYNDYLRVYVPVGAELLDPSGRQSSSPARDGDFQVFTQPLVARPMDHAVADFSYVLPDHVQSGAAYRLTWVRQAGTPNDQLRVVVDGRTTMADAAVRTLRITAFQNRQSVLSLLRRRWVVRRLSG